MLASRRRAFQIITRLLSVTKLGNPVKKLRPSFPNSYFLRIPALGYRLVDHSYFDNVMTKFMINSRTDA